MDEEGFKLTCGVVMESSQYNIFCFCPDMVTLIASRLLYGRLPSGQVRLWTPDVVYFKKDRLCANILDSPLADKRESLFRRLRYTDMYSSCEYDKFESKDPKAFYCPPVRSRMLTWTLT